MVGLVVVSHSARLAAGVVELAREMAADVPIAAAGGLDPPAPDEPAPLGTDAAKVMAAVADADDGSGDGVLVLMDLGSAILSAEAARDLLEPELAARVRLAAAPLVEGAVAAAVAAQAGASLAQAAAEARRGLAPKAAQLGDGDGPPGGPDADAGGGAAAADVAPPAADGDDDGGVVEARFTVTVAQGLHARPAARFVRAAASADATIEVVNATTGAGPAPARSLTGVATLGVREGHEVIVRARGPEAQAAIDALRAVATGAGDAAGAADAADRPGPPAAGAAAAAPDGAPDAGAGDGSAPTPPTGPLRGLPASPGVALGPIRQLGATAPPPIPDGPAGPPEREWAALTRARAAVRAELARRRARLAADVGGDEAEILDALALALDDEALLRPARAAIDGGAVGAARAWADAVAAAAARYAALDDPYQRARAADLEDLGRRVLRALAADRAGGEAAAGAGAAADAGAPASAEGPADGPDAAAADDAPAIVVADELAPIDAAALDPAAVAGVATAAGGPTSHGAILARALGVPAVVGLGAAVRALPDGRRAVLDGDAGLLVPDPTPAQERQYVARRDRARAAAAAARARAAEPAVTRDGVAVEVAANAADPRDVADAVAQGADGIGLLRTEFAFLGRAQAPTEEEQLEVYRAAARALDGRPLVIRTLDAGADKPLPYLDLAPEANPFLGVRGIRLGLARPALLAAQLRAIVRVAAEHGNVKAMLPMVATRGELRAARALLVAALADTGARPRPGFELGIMVEVPAAALTADRLAVDVDFLSIGTNDLTQYALAAERGNAAVAALADGLHPAVLALVARVCDAAAARGRWVGVCGELAADPLAVGLLVGLGVRELSVAAPSVAAVKAAVRALDAGAARALARRALAAGAADEVRALVVSEPDAAGRR